VNLSEISSHLSRKFRDELLSNLVAVEDFNVSNCSRDNVKDQHSFDCVQVQTTVARAVASFRFGLGIKRRAEVISASATVYDLQLWHLGSQLNLSLLLEKLFKFKSQHREYFGK